MDLVSIIARILYCFIEGIYGATCLLSTPTIYIYIACIPSLPTPGPHIHFIRYLAHTTRYM